MNLRIERVSVTYADKVAVDKVSLTLAGGQVMALLGPSGCGKSTLLRAITGLEPLAAGRITLDGVDLASVPVHHRRFGLMFQDGVLFPQRSVAGNIAYGLRMAGAGRLAQAKRVDELLDLVGLAGYQHRRVGTLSGGEAQRVALARALAPRPRLLLLDEPLAALDAALRDRLLIDLRAILRMTGTTAIFVTHDQDEAFAIADQVAVMAAGRIRQHGPPRQVWDAPADEWVAAFVGYTTVLEPDSFAAVVHGAKLDGLIALRPAALVYDDTGEIAAQLLAAIPGPDLSRLEVTVDGWGTVHAVGPTTPPPVGQIRLRFDPAGAATIAART